MLSQDSIHQVYICRIDAINHIYYTICRDDGCDLLTDTYICELDLHI